MTHKCEWPGCEIDVPPKLWGCEKHWRMLPLQLRYKINNIYDTGASSIQHTEAANQIREWIRRYESYRETREARPEKQSKDATRRDKPNNAHEVGRAT